MAKSTPPTPPEAALIKSALKRRRITARAAAHQAGIGEARWYQIMRGNQTVGGARVPVVAPPDTLARMAHAVGVTPEQLEEVDRADAAEELRDLAQHETPPPPGDRDDPGVRALKAVWQTLEPEDRTRALRSLQQEAQLQEPDGEERPYADMSDPELTIWSMKNLTREDRLSIINVIRAGRGRHEHTA